MNGRLHIHRKSKSSTSWTVPSQKQSRPNITQAQPHSKKPQGQTEQQKFEITKLNIQAKNGTITPEGQERLTVLQAQNRELLVSELQRAERFGHNLSKIPINSPYIVSHSPIQPKFTIRQKEKSNKEFIHQKFSPPWRIQPKLTIGMPRDKYEQEADRVASQVVSMPEKTVQREIAPEETETDQEREIREGSPESTPGAEYKPNKPATPDKSEESWWDRGIDWAEGKIAGGAHELASKAKGIPVLEQATNAGAWATEQSSQLTGGLLKGAGTMVGGIANMVTHPIDTAMGLETMAEHVPLLGIPNPLKAAHGLYDIAVNGKDVGEVANNVLNPVQSIKDDLEFGKKMVDGITKPYQQEIKEGKYAEAIGRGVFDIGSIVLTAGEGAGAKGVAVAGEVANAARVAEGAAVAGEVADAARVAEGAAVASDATKAAGISDATKVASQIDEAGQAASGIDDVTKVASEGTEVTSTSKSTEFTEALAEPNQSEVVHVETTDKRMSDLAEIADSRQVRSLSNDPELAEAWGKAGETARSNAEGRAGFNNQRRRMKTQLSKEGVVLEGDIHHWKYPINEYPSEAMNAENLYLTDDKPTHTKLHQTMGSESRPFSEMEWGQQGEVQNMFDFWNSEQQLKDVPPLLEEWEKKHPN